MTKRARIATVLSQRHAQSASINFPMITEKGGLECRALLDDQILVIDNFFSLEECKSFVRLMNNLPMELTPPKKKGEAERLNYRISITSVEFAQILYTVLRPHLPAFPYPASVRRPTSEHFPHSLNSNIRMYKYTAGQHFGCHYDDSVRDPLTGAKSEWTLLIYLTGIEDGVQGGEVGLFHLWDSCPYLTTAKTIFYKDQKGRSTGKIVVPLTRGSALLHRHGAECLLHEGSPVIEGNKFILRSDLMFMK